MLTSTNSGDGSWASWWKESINRSSSAAADGRLAGLLWVAAQLAGVLWLIFFFNIEPASGIQRLLPLIFVGFLVNAALHLRYRQPFFVLLSLGAFAVVLGPIPALLLAVLTLGFLGVAHLRVAFSTRVLLILFAGAALAAIRSGWHPTFLSDIPQLALALQTVAPVLASVLMFRLVIYLYELRHEERDRALATAKPGGARHRKNPQATVWTRLAYFFLLPNVCFLLFPIVDYRTTQRTYYDTDSRKIYQNGVWWISLGLVYLLVYRLVYLYMVPSPEDVRGIGGVVRYAVSSYFIALRIIGQFHLIIGILCLFGFNLPPAFKWMFLASSFTDFWRRARIEWKDFMVKVFYYPVFVPLQRKWGPTLALVAATVFVFSSTWILHSYQWFWVMGDFRLSQTDALFWTVFGACVLANSLIDNRSARKRTSARGGKFDFGVATIRAVQMVGMFAFLSVLWSYWSSPGLSEWWSFITAASESGPLDYLLLLAAAVALVPGFVLVQFFLARADSPKPVASATISGSDYSKRRLMPRRWQPVAVCASFALLLLTLPASRGSFGAPAVVFAESIRSNRLNAVDQERHDRGYYETLLDEPRSTAAFIASNADMRRQSASWTGAKNELSEKDGGTNVDGQTNQPEADSPVSGGEDAVAILQGPSRQTNDILRSEPLPLTTFVKKGTAITTNRWGMRDKDYNLVPPPGTYRIVLLGGSYERANGLLQTDGFESIVEDRLNRSARTGKHYEILNFSNGFYSVLQHSVLIERRVLEFKPDAVFYALHSADSRKLMPHLLWLVRKQIPIPYPYVQKKLQAAGVRSDMSEIELRRRIEPVLDDIQRWSYRRIVELCRANGVKPIALVVPITDEGPPDKQRREQYEVWARDAGFTLLSLVGAYGTHTIQEISLSPGDAHPSVLGNRLLAEKLYAVMRRADGTVLPLGLGKEAPSQYAASPDPRPAAADTSTQPLRRTEDKRGARRNSGWSGGAPAMARSEVVELTDNILQYQLLKSHEAHLKGASFITNSWGMRDKNYAKVPPAGAYRFALLGSTLAMGAGVPENATFESLLEDKLNRAEANGASRRYEILNFAVANYSVLQNFAVLEKKALAFKPNAVLLVLEPTEVGRLAKELNSLLAPGSTVPYAFVREKLRSSGVTSETLEAERPKQLYGPADAVVAWSLQQMASLCRQRGIQPVALALPTPDGPPEQKEWLSRIAGQAKAAGFIVMEPDGVFAKKPGGGFVLKGSVLNADGHRAVAERLYQMLRQNARALKMGLAAAPIPKVVAVSVPVANTLLAESAVTAPIIGPLTSQKFVRMTGDVLGYEFLPSFNGSYKGASFRTNRWGMRDREYSMKPGRDTYRIALLGSSLSLGAGVPEDQTHEALLEAKLNRSGPRVPSRTYEVLNFSVGGYSLLQNVALADKKVFEFYPNAVIIVIHSVDQDRFTNYLISMMQSKIPIPYDFIRKKIAEVGALPDMQRPELRRRLSPVAQELLAWSYQRIAAQCRTHHVALVGVAIPAARESGKLASVIRVASAAGVPVLDLTDVFKDQPFESVALGEDDIHLSAAGHRLVADRLYDLLRANDSRALNLNF